MNVNRGKHNMRFGSLLERNSYDSSDIRNAQGTFTFSSLADYEAGRPTTYTQRIGDPQVGYNYWTAGLYAQDDVRVRKDLTLSLGIRQEWQSYVDSTINLAPRVGIAWSPLKSGNVSVTGGAGIFYDWLDANTYEETLQVDGVRVQDIIVRNPSYPDVSNGGVLQVLPSGRYEIADGVDMPRLWQASLGVERRMGAMGRLNVSYRYREGTDELRGRNMNAPVAGVRPDPSLGNVIQVPSNWPIAGAPGGRRHQRGAPEAAVLRGGQLHAVVREGRRARARLHFRPTTSHPTSGRCRATTCATAWAGSSTCGCRRVCDSAATCASSRQHPTPSRRALMTTATACSTTGRLASRATASAGRRWST